jgi:hypothetical protein
MKYNSENVESTHLLSGLYLTPIKKGVKLPFQIERYTYITLFMMSIKKTHEWITNSFFTEIRFPQGEYRENSIVSQGQMT